MYSYKCYVCGTVFDTSSRATQTCPSCLNRYIRRDYSTVQIGKPFQSHFNHAVGSYITSDKQFNDLLKKRGDESGSTYTRVDPGDIPAPTKDDYILENQARTIHDKNINPTDLV